LEIVESTVALGPILRTAPVRGALEHFYRAGVSTQIAQTALDLDQQGYDEAVALVGSITDARGRSRSSPRPASRGHLPPNARRTPRLWWWCTSIAPA